MSFPTEKQLRDRFDRSEHAVYFATADKRTRYYGFGVREEKFGADFQDVAAWAREQRYPVFGGFSFDEQSVTDSALMNGYFVLPEVLYDITDQHLWGRETDPFGAPIPIAGPAITSQTDERDWPDRVQTAVDDMQQNSNHQKVVLGRQRQVRLTGELNLATLLADLATQQPDSYHFVLKRGDEVFVSATPERLAKVNRGQFETAGVAGTIRRGADEAEDARLATELLQDPKNLQEHAYVVETIVSRLQDVATLTLPDGPQIMKNPQVQHLYTPIAGQLNGDNTVLALAERLHPTPALGGKPVDWAMATIRTIEQHPRGLFAGPIGVVKPDGDGEMIVGIRSMWLKQQTATLFAGAGILADSDVQAEFEETGLKMTPMMNLLKEQDK